MKSMAKNTFQHDMLCATRISPRELAMMQHDM